MVIVISIIVLVILSGLFYLFVKKQETRQLNKLRRNYVKTEDKSSPGSPEGIGARANQGSIANGFRSGERPTSSEGFGQRGTGSLETGQPEITTGTELEGRRFLQARDDKSNTTTEQVTRENKPVVGDVRKPSRRFPKRN